MKKEEKDDYIKLTSKGWFKTQVDINFGDVIVPAGFRYNGANVPSWVVPFLGKRFLYLAAYAACIHDYKATYPEKYPRKAATKQLVDLWVRAGLPKWKGAIVYIFVEMYCKYVRKWK